MLPNFFPIMSLVLVSYKVIKFYQIIGGGGLWYGMAPPIHVGNSIFLMWVGCEFRKSFAIFWRFYSAFDCTKSLIAPNRCNPRPHYDTAVCPLLSLLLYRYTITR